VQLRNGSLRRRALGSEDAAGPAEAATDANGDPPISRHPPGTGCTSHDTARLERHVYKVTAAVTLVRPEDDGDFHLVLRAGLLHMIAEAPSPGCIARATPVRRGQMRAARAAVHVCGRSSITGVSFFDFNHGQIGVAPNAIELHPILRSSCLSR
jgi:hypothetical protein